MHIYISKRGSLRSSAHKAVLAQELAATQGIIPPRFSRMTEAIHGHAFDIAKALEAAYCDFNGVNFRAVSEAHGITIRDFYAYLKTRRGEAASNMRGNPQESPASDQPEPQ